MLKAHAKKFHRLVVAADIALGGAAYSVALAVPGHGHTPTGSGTARLVALGIIAALVWPVGFQQLGLYKSLRRFRRRDLLSRLAAAACLATAVLAVGTAALRAPVAAGFPLLCALIQLLTLAAFRAGALEGLRLLRRRGRNYRNILVVGSGPRARHVRGAVQSHPEWGLRIVGYVDERDTAADPALATEPIHKIVDFPRLVGGNGIDEVIVACPRAMFPAITPVVAICASTGIPLTILSDLFGDFFPPPRVTRFDSIAALSFAPIHHSRFKLAVKRAIDVGGATALLVPATPVILAAAGAIRLTSPGAALFRQVRCGRYGRSFGMWKLRTMCDGADRMRDEVAALNVMDGPTFKAPDDPRVTPVGHLLRRWSIDELPQLWNVLKGDMSLVGPRPPIPEEVAQYDMAQRRRLSMRPGLTCLWQVNGRNQIGFEDWVKLDLEYIDTWSLTNDLKLLLRTIPAVFRGTGAS